MKSYSSFNQELRSVANALNFLQLNLSRYTCKFHRNLEEL
jgi:hypothetical protein